MADIERKSRQNDARSADREEYARPKLKVFGQVGALTQSGTGLEIEGMMNEIDRQPMA